MPVPQTGVDQAAPNTPLWTFDAAGNLNLSGSVTIDAPVSLDGRSLLPGTPAGGSAVINVQTVTAYTLQPADLGAIVVMDNASASTLTVPADAAVDFPTGALIEICQAGAGAVTIAPASGVTINSPGGNLVINDQYTTIGLFKLSADTWVANGNLSA
jgi:hypothetical protein